MPISFVHPAAILPLVNKRRGGWPEALVIGSLMPDALRVLPFPEARELTHSAPGLVLLVVPSTILATYVFRRLASPRLARLPALSDRLAATPFQWLWVAAAALIAGSSHLAWDAFTHEESPFLQGSLAMKILFMTPVGPFRVRQLLWYVNSFAGSLVLLGWGGWKLRSFHQRVPGAYLWPWLVFLLVFAAPFVKLFEGFPGGSRGFLLEFIQHQALHPELMERATLTAMAASFVAILLATTLPLRFLSGRSPETAGSEAGSLPR